MHYWLPTIVMLASASAGSAQTALIASGELEAVCDAREGWASAADNLPNLQGTWDLLVEVGKTESRGEMALGPIDDHYAGSTTLYATNSLAIRKLTKRGAVIHMPVASREGDVVYDGWVSRDGNRLCGLLTYHQGQRYRMTALRRGKPTAQTVGRRPE